MKENIMCSNFSMVFPQTRFNHKRYKTTNWKAPSFPPSKPKFVGIICVIFIQRVLSISAGRGGVRLAFHWAGRGGATCFSAGRGEHPCCTVLKSAAALCQCNLLQHLHQQCTCNIVSTCSILSTYNIGNTCSFVSTCYVVSTFNVVSTCNVDWSDLWSR